MLVHQKSKLKNKKYANIFLFYSERFPTVFHLLIPVLVCSLVYGMVFVFYYNQIPRLDRLSVACEASVSDRMDFKLSPGSLEILNNKRSQAIKKGALISGPEDYVPASIMYGGKTFEAMVRLKGDFAQEVDRGVKWPLRVELSDGQTIRGMSKFSLHHPDARNGVFGWIYHTVLGKEDVMHLRYEFIRISINGSDLGIYALEEHFTKYLVEHNQRRDGPIIKFYEDTFWTDKFQYDALGETSSPSGLQSEFAAPIDAFELNRILNSQELSGQFQSAHNLLESFRRGDLKTSEVFDVERMARFYAISDLLGGQHGAGIWHNLRFYFNPMTTRLEPIGFDSNSGTQINNIAGVIQPDAFHKNLFSDRVFFEAYVKSLSRVSQPDYLDQVLRDLNEGIGKNLRLLACEFPGENFSIDVLLANRHIIERALNPVKAVYAYVKSVLPGNLILQVGNVQSLPLVIDKISYKNFMTFYPNQPVFTVGRNPSENIRYSEIGFLMPKNFQWEGVKVDDFSIQYHILGLNKTENSVIFSWSQLTEGFFDDDVVRVSAPLSSFKFLAVNEEEKKIFILPGKWVLDENLVVPSGYTLIAREDTQIDLRRSSMILSYSPMVFSGTNSSPIIISSSDGTGQGVAIVTAGARSIFNHVIFSGILYPHKKTLQLTGAFTAYESDIDLDYVSFRQIEAEDAINIMRSNFSIKNSHFEELSSDAVDIDFGRGEITSVLFRNIGNDAIDASGSNLKLSDITINSAKDKGISAGEQSYINGSKIIITDSGIGIASKDSSQTQVSDIKLENNALDFTAFQKKSEFGPGFLNVERAFNLSGGAISYLLEKGSEFLLDGVAVVFNSTKLKAELYDD
jgi:hypothetical protein